MESIIILGIEITRERFPNLYPMAETDPERFAEQLIALAKATGSDDLPSTAVILEHDLAHEKATTSGSSE